MTDEEYRTWAEEEFARLEVQRHEAEIANLIGQRKHATERQTIHERLCRKHSLNPATASLRQVADYEISHIHAWREFVTNKFSGLDTLRRLAAGEVLNPETIT